MLREAVFTFAALVSVAGCRSTATGYPFHSRGVYEAPHSGYRFEVVGSGSVAAGADVSDSGSGLVRFCPLLGTSAATLSLELRAGSGSARYEISGTLSEKGSASWGSRNSVTTLQTQLSKAGYAHLDKAELDESVRAIEGVLAGPKGTVLAGQSRSLGVVATTLSRTAPPGRLRSSPCGAF
jgi:hypothetical protein